jgi:hypothetical protein
MKTIEIQKREVVDDRILVTVAVKEGSKELFGRTLAVRSERELNGTLANLLNERTNVEVEAEKIVVGKWTPPTPQTIEERTPPTAEELKAQEISAKEQELQEEIERAKREREVAELAQSDAGVQSKLAELEVLRGKK